MMSELRFLIETKLKVAPPSVLADGNNALASGEESAPVVRVGFVT